MQAASRRILTSRSSNCSTISSQMLLPGGDKAKSISRPACLYIEQLQGLQGRRAAACFTNLKVGAFIEVACRLAVIRMCMYAIRHPPDEKWFTEVLTEMLQLVKERRLTLLSGKLWSWTQSVRKEDGCKDAEGGEKRKSWLVVTKSREE